VPLSGKLWRRWEAVEVEGLPSAFNHAAVRKKPGSHEQNRSTILRALLRGAKKAEPLYGEIKIIVRHSRCATLTSSDGPACLRNRTQGAP
jgi:hypothetical protein